MYQGVQRGDNYPELAKLEVEIIDPLLESTGNVFMQIVASSSKQTRQVLTEKSYLLIDVKAHLHWLTGMVRLIVSGIMDVDETVHQYVEYIDKTLRPLKNYLCTLPKEPHLIASPLHNEKNIMDLDDIMRNESENIISCLSAVNT
jgi:GntR family transcriptional repressor for pyruvate dehydrogenase complex